ncbi:unnamed protein product [Paramecium primaurelia]|uniref:Uncharacterized protein n=1 Tax=Paramecium primaurelia TaxID=5886 RepID=A0A8S1P845_PARPR|nr:unnamed protein product [Paramecium primaurelia]
MNYNSYQSQKPYSRIQQQTYNNNKILLYVEQVLQKSRINYNKQSNYNQTLKLIQISKISIPTLKIKASSIHLKQYNKNIKSIRNKKLHLIKLFPFINHNKIQTNSQQFHQFHL